jgi:molybdopterin synthase sulfur carrier subunit
VLSEEAVGGVIGGLRPTWIVRLIPGLKSPTDKEIEMAIVVRIPTPLRAMTKGAAEVHAEANTIGDVITDLERQFPGLRDRIVEESGEIRRFVNIYVNQEDIRFLEGDKTALKPGDEVSIVPAIAGGR